MRQAPNGHGFSRADRDAMVRNLEYRNAAVRVGCNPELDGVAHQRNSWPEYVDTDRCTLLM